MLIRFWKFLYKADDSPVLQVGCFVNVMVIVLCGSCCFQSGLMKNAWDVTRVSGEAQSWLEKSHRDVQTVTSDVPLAEDDPYFTKYWLDGCVSGSAWTKFGTDRALEFVIADYKRYFKEPDWQMVQVVDGYWVGTSSAEQFTASVSLMWLEPPDDSFPASYRLKLNVSNCY